MDQVSQLVVVSTYGQLVVVSAHGQPMVTLWWSVYAQHVVIWWWSVHDSLWTVGGQCSEGDNYMVSQ